jgi:hypothetical protein
MGEMMLKRLFEIGGFAFQRLVRQDDIAQNADDGRKRLDLGKREHIGRRILAAPVAVEVLLLGIVGEDDRNLGSARDLRPGSGKGGENRLLGQRVVSLRPAFAIAQDGDFDRWRAQLRPPSSLGAACS